MAKHFLYSAEARTISLKQVFNMTEEEAHELFKQIRWEENAGNPICPHCGSRHKIYWVKSKKAWKCARCTKRFSVTSGTIFAHHKLLLKDYLAAIVIFANSVKGISASQLCRDLDVQHLTAFVLSHKIREALVNFRDTSLLEGEVEIDGAYFGGYVKPKNKKEDRIDRRLAENQNPNKRCVMVIRERSQTPELKGAARTVTFIVKEENQAATQRIDSDASIHADQHASYDLLHSKFDVKRVNHDKEYKNKDTKACTNLAESYFARFTRCFVGQHHRMSPVYLPYYAQEIAYREDTRRKSNGDIVIDILSKALKSPTSKELCGYWQGNHRKVELLGLTA